MKAIVRYAVLVFMVVVLIATSAVIRPQVAKAEGAAVAGTIFKSTIYGIGLGVIIGGLVMVAQSQDVEKIAPSLATWGLGGAAVGAGIGIIEVALDSQYRQAMLENSRPGLQAPRPVVLFSKAPNSSKMLNNFGNRSVMMGTEIRYIF